MITCPPAAVLTNGNQFICSTTITLRSSCLPWFLTAFSSSSPLFLIGKFLAQRICSILSTISTYVLLSRILLSVTSLTCSISSTTSIICVAACKRDQRKEQEWKLMITQVNHPPPLPHSLTLLSCRRHSNSNTEEKALVVRWKCYKATIKPLWITFL